VCAWQVPPFDSLWNVADSAHLGSGDRARNEHFVAARIGELAHRRDRLSSRHGKSLSVVDSSTLNEANIISSPCTTCLHRNGGSTH
jgi:hypothetical protein